MNKKYKINTFSLIFILYIFFIIVNDYFCFILNKSKCNFLNNFMLVLHYVDFPEALSSLQRFYPTPAG